MILYLISNSEIMSLCVYMFFELMFFYLVRYVLIYGKVFFVIVLGRWICYIGWILVKWECMFYSIFNFDG